MADWKDRYKRARDWPDPLPPAKKAFKPKFLLPHLQDYRKDAPAGFWELFPENLTPVAQSWVCPTKLKELAELTGYRDREILNKVCEDLKNGADIGCKGDFREASASQNAPSAFEYAEEVTDAIAGWVSNGIVAGPFERAERPADVKVNGIMCRAKPNGTARVILNLSAPSGRSVNEGIDAAEFPATMGSTEKWLDILRKAGRGAIMLKIDWSEAYKHVHVRAEDQKLQWFSWLGKDFYELRLVFGGASSCGIYDRLAKIVLHIVTAIAHFPPSMICQYLDDVCAAAAANQHGAVHDLMTTYHKVAKQLGVRLAPTDDPDKAFPPSTHGTVLGVTYDTEKWTWDIPREKAGRLLQQIRETMDSQEIRQDEMWSLTGRLLHYMPLMPGGRFNIDEVLKANSFAEEKEAMVPISQGLKRQLWFWLSMIKTINGCTGIPVDLVPPQWQVEFFTDAAGGTTESSGRGSGGVAPGFWFYLPWTREINNGTAKIDGKKVGRKLSALELVGPLICVSAAFERCRSMNTLIWVDNMGSVIIWRKGYSMKCPLCNTLVKAIATVAAGSGCRLEIRKTRRRATQGAVLADEISKGNLSATWDAAGWNLAAEPAAIPKAILKWICNPVGDPDLGEKILSEISERTRVLGR